MLPAAAAAGAGAGAGAAAFAAVRTDVDCAVQRASASSDRWAPQVTRQQHHRSQRQRHLVVAGSSRQ